ncbi:hypothetical protein FBHYGVHD_CDS0092 [Staphylococcus phage MVC_VPHSA1]|uniref:IrrE N-terminal-like domain-containing protein n=1 Tax=Staphylococcus phage MVC_VPHSA1 TaxID=3088876 RepID=A0ABZ0QYS2_9CAUD|nr:hypothetical protein FBHYGVHD_CDS0092 [Staphylococcus phage MVC_VPHSA1]
MSYFEIKATEFKSLNRYFTKVMYDLGVTLKLCPECHKDNAAFWNHKEKPMTIELDGNYARINNLYHLTALAHELGHAAQNADKGFTSNNDALAHFGVHEAEIDAWERAFHMCAEAGFTKEQMYMTYDDMLDALPAYFSEQGLDWSLYVAMRVDAKPKLLELDYALARCRVAFLEALKTVQ